MFKKFLLASVIFFLSCCPVMAGNVEYVLPYPGLLPDSPIYILKVARDNFVEKFIRDEKQKAFYYLFLSDKRLAAGEALVKKKNLELGATTILVSQNYFSQASDLAVKIKDPDLTTKLIVSGAKHENVISELEKNHGEDREGKLRKALISSQKDKNRVLELMIPR